MNNPEKSPQNRWLLYAGIVIGIAIFSIVATYLSLIISHPTPDHLQTSQELAELSRKSEQTADNVKLTQSPEARYILLTGVIAALVELVLTVLVLAYLYAYLRKNLITKNAVWTTVILFILGSTLAVPFSTLITQSILGLTPLENMLTMLLAVIFNISIGTLVTYLIVRGCKWHYDRHHPAESQNEQLPTSDLP